LIVKESSALLLRTIALPEATKRAQTCAARPHVVAPHKKAANTAQQLSSMRGAER
jgi:hypothetical protein